MSVYKARCGPSLDTEHVSTLVLNCPGSRTVKNKFLLLVSHTVCDVLLQQPELTRTEIESLTSLNLIRLESQFQNPRMSSEMSP